jgi:hypothetical protein
MELTGTEIADVIAALTNHKLRLQDQRAMFDADGQHQWVSDVDAEIVRIDALKDRFFK